jgi:hypothetical protein
MIKLLGVREKMEGKIEEVKQEVTQAVEDGKIASATHLGFSHNAPDFIVENRKEVLAQRKELRRTVLLQNASKRAKQNLIVKERSLMVEEEWKREVANKLVARQERQHRRMVQAKWLPGYMAVVALLRMHRMMMIAKHFRSTLNRKGQAVTVIQRVFRSILKSRSQVKILKPQLSS